MHFFLAGKRQTDAELVEARNAVNDMTSINSRAAAEKRGLESNVHTMQVKNQNQKI